MQQQKSLLFLTTDSSGDAAGGGEGLAAGPSARSGELRPPFSFLRLIARKLRGLSDSTAVARPVVSTSLIPAEDFPSELS